jgi:hypothetical protein
MCNEVDQLRCKKTGDQNKNHQNASNHRKNEGENMPAFGLIVFSKVPGENRDKGDRQKAAGNNMIQDFRNEKSQLVGIDRAAGTADVGDDHLSDQSDQPAQQD